MWQVPWIRENSNLMAAAGGGGLQFRGLTWFGLWGQDGLSEGENIWDELEAALWDVGRRELQRYTELQRSDSAKVLWQERT